MATLLREVMADGEAGLAGADDDDVVAHSDITKGPRRRRVLKGGGSP